MTKAQETSFRRFLEGVRWRGAPLAEKAIESRIVRAKQAEEILNKNIDAIVSTDASMRTALLDLRSGDSHGTRANAVRKYYEMKNGKSFPKLSTH